MTTEGFLIFQSILRERKIPRQHLRILHVFCEYKRRQAKPGLCGYSHSLRQQLKRKASQGIGRGKGWVGGLGRQEKGPCPFSLSPFFSLPLPPLPPPPPPPSFFQICYSHEGYHHLSLNTQCLFKLGSNEYRFPYVWPRSINLLLHVDEKMVKSSLTLTRLSTSSATMS